MSARARVQVGPLIGPLTPPAYNVLAGWLLGPDTIPPIPKQRRRPYRKTSAKRPRVKIEKLAA
jgi:hypothetical protein